MKEILRNNRCTITSECNIKGKKKNIFLYNKTFSYVFLIDLLNAVEWLLCYILEKSAKKVEQLTKRKDLSSFDLKNNAQVYHLRTLSIIYIQVKQKIVFSQDFILSLFFLAYCYFKILSIYRKS